ncbi:MAG: hypothetical protein ABGF52_13625 [Candidatus Asgardarchaeum sp.]
MIIFYQNSTGNIFSYVSYNLEYEGEDLLNRPSLDRLSSQHNINVSDIGIKKWSKENPIEADFKDNVDDLIAEELEEI